MSEPADMISVLKARLEERVKQRDQALANANAFIGAVQELEGLIGTLQAATEKQPEGEP